MTSVADFAERVDYGLTASARNEPIGPKFLRITDIQDDHVDWETVPFCDRNTKGVDKAQLAQGDIVFARTGATTGKSYLVQNPPQDAVFASYLIRLRLKPGADPSYVAHFFRSTDYWHQITTFSEGVAQPGVNATKLKQIDVPLPSVEEQQRIAAVLDAADELRTKRRQALAKLDTLTQAIFIDMFGNPVVNPAGYEVGRLTHLGSLNRGLSKHRPRNDPALLGGQWPLIQTGDVANSSGYIDSYSSTYSELGLRQSQLWPTGTLCITIAANIAKTGILQMDACFPDSVVGFAASHSDDNEYVRALLNFLQPILEANAPESAQKNINLKVLRELPIPIPSSPERAKFAGLIHDLNGQRRLLEEDGVRLDTLFASLQQKAFNGEL